MKNQKIILTVTIFTAFLATHLLMVNLSFGQVKEGDQYEDSLMTYTFGPVKMFEGQVAEMYFFNTSEKPTSVQMLILDVAGNILSLKKAKVPSLMTEVVEFDTEEYCSYPPSGAEGALCCMCYTRDCCPDDQLVGVINGVLIVDTPNPNSGIPSASLQVFNSSSGEGVLLADPRPSPIFLLY